MIGTKLALLLAIFAAGAAGGSLPLWRGGAAGSPRWLGLGTSFAAGIFLAAGLVHMLPEAHRVFGEAGFAFPIAFVLAAAALAGMLLIEHVLLPDHVHEEIHVPSDERFGHDHGHAHHDAVSAYSALVALSIHSLVGGLALGAEQETARVLVIFLAIFAHKSAEGFALGISLARSSIGSAASKRLIALFALSTPLGGLLGMALGQVTQGPTTALIEGVFLGIAAGTFMYVATFDVLRDELPHSGGRLTEWLAMAAGIAGMSALALWS